MVYIAVLSAVDNISWYITRFCLPLPWTMMIAMSPGFVYLGFVSRKMLSFYKKNRMYAILQCNATYFVCHGQFWLVKQPILSAMDNNGWKSNRFCLPWTVVVGQATGCVCH